MCITEVVLRAEETRGQSSFCVVAASLRPRSFLSYTTWPQTQRHKVSHSGEQTICFLKCCFLSAKRGVSPLQGIRETLLSMFNFWS